MSCFIRHDLMSLLQNKTSRLQSLWLYGARLTAVICWMVVIFLLSHEAANESHARSSVVVEFIPVSDVLVRKLAHVTLYAVLGILTAWAMMAFQLTKRKVVLWAVLIGAGYAITDEFHQLFVQGRSGEFPDVLIDTTGAVIGVLTAVGVWRYCQKRFHNSVQHDIVGEY